MWKTSKQGADNHESHAAAPDPALSIFIASASEGLEVATALRDALQSNKGFEARVWNETTVKPSMTFIEALEAELDQCDFAVLAMTPDDRVISRGKSSMAPRDNVLFEIGLFTGRIGRERTYFVFDKARDPKIPTDLLGVTPACYGRIEGKSLSESVIGACVLMAKRMKELGERQKYSAEEKSEIRTVREFCGRIAGIWWQQMTSDDEVRLSLFRITPDNGMHTVQMEGDSFDREGDLVAHWRSVAAGVRASDKTLFYSWQGQHPTSAPGKDFEGFGQFTFKPSPNRYSRGDGLFADVQIGKKAVVWKSVEIGRIEPEDENGIDRVMREGSRSEKACVARELSERLEHGLVARGARG